MSQKFFRCIRMISDVRSSKRQFAAKRQGAVAGSKILVTGRGALTVRPQRPAAKA